MINQVGYCVIVSIGQMTGSNGISFFHTKCEIFAKSRFADNIVNHAAFFLWGADLGAVVAHSVCPSLLRTTLKYFHVESHIKDNIPWLGHMSFRSSYFHIRIFCWIITPFKDGWIQITWTWGFFSLLQDRSPIPMANKKKKLKDYSVLGKMKGRGEILTLQFKSLVLQNSRNSLRNDSIAFLRPTMMPIFSPFKSCVIVIM